MKVRLPKEVVWTKLGEEVAILNAATGTYFGLDPVGSRIWCLVAEEKSLDEVVATVLLEYQIDETQVRADLGELIDQLAARSLVEISPDEEPRD
jgi:hypothetical protein